MSRKASDLNALTVSRLGTKRAPRPDGLKPRDPNPRAGPGLHAVGTVPGLYLQVLPSGARTWILRTMIGGQRPHLGLG